MSNLAQKLRDWRKAKGLSQEQAASLLETVQPVLSRIERGERLPSVPLARRLVEQGAITADDFIAAPASEAA